MDPVYLDHAATTPLAPEVREAMEPFLGERFGNPSSRHPLGVAAAGALDEARRRMARATGARPADVVFTSGGTEANNLAVLGLARARRSQGRHVLVGPTEHSSVAAPARALREEGFQVETLPVDGRGDLDLEALERLLRPETVLVAQMLVSNELGTRYDLPAVARRVRARAPHAALHVDAVQGLGKVDVRLGELGAHSLAVSAHKVNGPKGSGALVLAEGVRPRPLVHGGGQEQGLRSGTENVAGCVGLGVAAERAEAAQAEPATAAHLATLRQDLEAGLAHVAGARLLAAGRTRVPFIHALELPGPPAEVWMHHLEARGVFTSVGSACQARKQSVSPALAALGLDEARARQVLRVSVSRHTTREELARALATLADVERELGALR